MPRWRRRPGGSCKTYWEVTTQGGYQRNYDRMQAALAKAMRQPNALAYTVSAEVLAKQGRYAEAFTEIDSAMALAPSSPDNYLSKARVLNATGRAAEAEESVRWAMRLDPLYSAGVPARARDFAFQPATLRGGARDHRQTRGTENRYRRTTTSH